MSGIFNLNIIKVKTLNSIYIYIACADKGSKKNKIILHI